MIVKLTQPTEGTVWFQGEEIFAMKKDKTRELRRKIQMIFQDPYSSLDPRMSAGRIIMEPLLVHGQKDQAREKALSLMDDVGLLREYFDRYPHEFSGGQRQRIGVARALALNPSFIVCDEPVSALDVSIQAQIVNLMQDLQEELDLTYLFITHNMAVVKHISDNILVMYMGKMVEFAPSGRIFSDRLHPYTQALLAAVPVPVLGGKKGRHLLKGEITSPVNPKPGCRFAKRCEYATELCSTEEPAFTEALPGHFVACHHVKKINGLS